MPQPDYFVPKHTIYNFSLLRWIMGHIGIWMMAYGAYPSFATLLTKISPHIHTSAFTLTIMNYIYGLCEIG